MSQAVPTFYFYDLETSGFNPKTARIMQFAGQRTDMDLNPVGQPHNILVKMTPDTLPDPDAVLVTGITPQATIADGVTEAEFLKIFYEEIALPGTIFLGYNTVRFDDEFIRYLNYRNFYDPYEWQWQDGRSRWDLLDVVRMTRALRPEGIEWPFDSEGKPTNRLELLTAVNKLEHAHAHDALSDVMASIAVAKLIRSKHAKLFDYLLDMRGKQKVAELVTSRQPFVYASGKYPSEFQKTTVAVMIAQPPKNQGALVYDLRHDPKPLFGLSPADLAAAWQWKPERTKDDLVIPIKTLAFNKCPAVAPMGVLDEPSRERLSINLEQIQKHHNALRAHPDFANNVSAAAALMDKARQQTFLSDDRFVDGQLYDGFFDAADKTTMSAIRAGGPDDISGLAPKLKDSRLQELLPLYKARNFSKSLTIDEQAAWEKFRVKQLLGGGQHSRMAAYFARIQEIAGHGNLTGHQEYLLEELHLYAQSIMPESEE